MSTNSDPNDSSVSLLARISAKRGQDASAGNSASTPVDVSPPSALQFSARPPTGSLRVDTTALDNPVIKQNKSAYPTFASNGVILPAVEQISVKSPIPVTAGPDLGRHNASRLEIVGYNQVRQRFEIQSHGGVTKMNSTVCPRRLILTSDIHSTALKLTSTSILLHHRRRGRRRRTTCNRRTIVRTTKVHVLWATFVLEVLGIGVTWLAPVTLHRLRSLRPPALAGRFMRILRGPPPS
jgi:hypothetical protein